MACHGQKSLTSSFVRLTFRLSWFRAHIIWKDRVVKYDDVYRQIDAAVKKYWENEKWRWNIYRKSFQTRGFGENLDDFWPRYCRAMKRNWNCVTCRDLFLTAERKGKFTCWGSDVLFLFLFGKLCRIELPLARLGHLGKSWWNISPFLASYIRVLCYSELFLKAISRAKKSASNVKIGQIVHHTVLFLKRSRHLGYPDYVVCYGGSTSVWDANFGFQASVI